jgi:hypothetical protein
MGTRCIKTWSRTATDHCWLKAQLIELILFAGWAHARRKFFEAKDHDRRAAWFLKQIGLLYALEKRLRQRKAGPKLRQTARAAEAAMILARIKKGLDRIGPKVLPQSLLGKAIHYTLEALGPS